MRISIVGITGYSGLELLRLIHHHPHIEVSSIHATQSIGNPISDLYPHLKGICDLTVQPFDANEIMKHSDLVVFATPSGIASQLSPEFVISDFPVVDISGDHRLPPDEYKLWYKKNQLIIIFKSNSHIVCQSLIHLRTIALYQILGVMQLQLNWHSFLCYKTN